MMGEMVRVLQRIDTVRYPYDPPISNLTLTGKIYKTKSGIWYVKTTSGSRYEFKTPPDKKISACSAWQFIRNIAYCSIEIQRERIWTELSNTTRC